MIRESFVTEIYLKQRLHAVCFIIWQIVDLKNFITTKMTKIIFFPVLLHQEPCPIKKINAIE